MDGRITPPASPRTTTSYSQTQEVAKITIPYVKEELGETYDVNIALYIAAGKAAKADCPDMEEKNISETSKRIAESLMRCMVTDDRLRIRKMSEAVLHAAAMGSKLNNARQVMEILINAGADLLYTNHADKTALQIAEASSHSPAIVDFLRVETTKQSEAKTNTDLSEAEPLPPCAVFPKETFKAFANVNYLDILSKPAVVNNLPALLEILSASKPGSLRNDLSEGYDKNKRSSTGD